MEIAGYFTLFIIAAMIISLAREITETGNILFLALATCLISGIINPSEALIGFSNQGMFTVGLLFIIAAGIQNTGTLNSITSLFLGKTERRSTSFLLFKMMMPVTSLSAFLNNTPIVMIFVPTIKKWAEKMNKASSKFLIPLSYASIFGGICTLIGTSTNLVVHGMMIANGMEGLSMFELAKIGIPCAIAGWIYIAFIGHRLLPNNKEFFNIVKENRKEYVIDLKVSPGCELIGKTIKEAGLRNLKNVYLIEIGREGKMFGPVSPKEKILANDILRFVGITSAIIDLQEIQGLVPAAYKMFENDFSSSSAHFVEAVVSESFPMLGKTVKEAAFRSKYKAGVIAIHRNGERVNTKIGDIRLHAGDVLLLLARDEFLRNWAHSRDFYLVSKVKEKETKSLQKAPLAAGIMVVMILAVTFRNQLPQIAGHKISMLYAAFIAVILMLITGCVTTRKAKKSIDLNVLLTIACAFGISKALQNSGAASVIAGFIINLVKGLGPVGILAAIYLLTTVFTEIITNNAAAALIFPIAFSAASQMGLNPKPFFIAIAIAASASFATPIGYQTNLIVQGAGRYKFTDYMKVGLPLNIVFFIISLIIIPLFWRF